jgi:hypothetical protein
MINVVLKETVFVKKLAFFSVVDCDLRIKKFRRSVLDYSYRLLLLLQCQYIALEKK